MKSQKSSRKKAPKPGKEEIAGQKKIRKNSQIKKKTETALIQEKESKIGKEEIKPIPEYVEKPTESISQTTPSSSINIKPEIKQQSIWPSTIAPASINAEQEAKKQNLYVKATIIVMLIILLTIGGTIWYRYESNKFEYAGLDFQYIMFDKLPLYHAKIPISSATGNVIANFNFYLRNDPRSLEEIPIQGRIKLQQNTIIALDSTMEECPDNPIAGVNLGQFLAAAGVKAIPGSTDQAQAEEQGLQYASCDSPSSVIITEKAPKTQILQEGSCYKIQVAECNDVVKATERFMLGAIGHSSGYDI